MKKLAMLLVIVFSLSILATGVLAYPPLKIEETSIDTLIEDVYAGEPDEDASVKINIGDAEIIKGIDHFGDDDNDDIAQGIPQEAKVKQQKRKSRMQ